jgi:hypothetical protein
LPLGVDQKLKLLRVALKSDLFGVFPPTSASTFKTFASNFVAELPRPEGGKRVAHQRRPTP